MTTPVSGRVIADSDRRFHAWLIDRLLALVLYAVAAVVAYVALIRRGHTLPGVLVVVVVALAGWFVGVLMTGLWGLTPGKSLRGLRVVSAATGDPIGLGAALLRQAIVGLGGYPTVGLGDVLLAWTATLDETGQRRAWHDRVAGSVVIDVRPRPVSPVVEEQVSEQVVNLTAMRLMPADAAVRAAVPRATPVPAASTPAQLRWRVTFDTGQSFVVEGLALVGRSPEPRRGEQAAHLVPLHSDDMSVSKTHAQFDVVPDGTLVVMDRGSTNGTVLLRGGVARPLSARQPATLLAGDRVRFGDREMAVAREA